MENRLKIDTKPPQKRHKTELCANYIWFDSMSQFRDALSEIRINYRLVVRAESIRKFRKKGEAEGEGEGVCENWKAKRDARWQMENICNGH